MKSINIAGKTLKLASRWARMGAFLIDGTLLAAILLISLFLLSTAVSSSLVLVLLSAALWILGSRSGIRGRTLIIAQVLLVFLHAQGVSDDFESSFLVSAALWMLGLFFMDGFKNGQGLGKKLLSLQVLRLKDGAPCTFKDSFIRRLSGIFQPLDMLWAFGKKRQRMGDKFAETVVVKLEDESEEIKGTTETLEKVLDTAILEMQHRLTEARQKVDASIGIEKQLQNAYEGALVQAERCEERAAIAVQAGREELAREDLARRNEYLQLASQYKAQWEEQKRVVAQLTELLETLQQKTAETQRKREAVIAQYKNVEAQKHIRQTLAELQGGEAFERLGQMEQEATEASILTKAAAEVDVEFKDAKSAREFARYADDASLDADLAELKAKLQK